MMYFEEYVKETGDHPPEPPKRMFVRRFPVKYTAAAKKWIEDDEAWRLRHLKWLHNKLQEEIETETD